MERAITFQIRDADTRFIGPSVELFGPNDNAVHWRPCFHVSCTTLVVQLTDLYYEKFQSDMSSFKRFYEYVQHFYVKGKPRHISSQNESHIHVIEATAYDAMSATHVQALLRTKHIVVTGCPQWPVSFDAKGLLTLANLDAPIDIQGN